MRNTYTVSHRTEVRAYYLYLNGSNNSALRDWLDAEFKELALAARRNKDHNERTMRRAFK